MKSDCPRCHNENRPMARFCARCGLSLTPGRSGIRRAGHIARPDALPVPEGFSAVGHSADLYFRLESAWGGKRLSDTENIGLVVFNAGYSLQNVVLAVRREGEAGTPPQEAEQTAERLPPGTPVMIEISSWEMTAGVKKLTVRLKSAEFAMES